MEVDPGETPALRYHAATVRGERRRSQGQTARSLKPEQYMMLRALDSSEANINDPVGNAEPASSLQGDAPDAAAWPEAESLRAVP